MKAYQQLNKYGKFNKLKYERRSPIKLHANSRVDGRQIGMELNEWKPTWAGEEAKCSFLKQFCW